MITQIKIHDDRIFFPKRAVNGFAGDASYQRADNLAKEIGGVVVSSDDDIRGARPSFWVYKDYADVPAKQYSRIEEDYTADDSYADYGFTKITLPKIGEVLARAVGADCFWREHICKAPFRAEIIQTGLSHNIWLEGRDCYFSTYELNWFKIPESEREKLLLATNGIKDEYFTKSNLARVEALETVNVRSQSETARLPRNGWLGKELNDKPCAYGIPKDLEGDPLDTKQCGQPSVYKAVGGFEYCAEHAPEVAANDEIYLPS